MDIVELTKSNMLDYSGAVNQSRAIPDARTGLKPIHRKIIYEMYADKVLSNSKYKKCAYMVGQIIARFSEHGDAATYDALIRLSQPWIQRYPLIDLHGNGGTQFGDPSAAMRYVEARLHNLTELGFLHGLNKQNIDWIPNFTNEEMEPSTLPAIFPGLFCLPNQGIGYACACNFLTYNLKDVADLVNEYIKTGKIKTIYYDLASGGTFINPEVMNSIYKTGKGSVIIESKYYIDNQTIHITELPFNVMFDDIVEDIIKLCESEEIVSINNVYNNSGNDKLDLVIEVNKAYDPEDVINELFNKTKLRSNYGINQIALVGGQPKLLSMEDMLEIYINHNIDCIKREFSYDMLEAQKRIHILNGLTLAVSNIDKVVNIIRTSKNPKEKLISNFSLDEEQINAILNMRLGKLSRLEENNLQEELSEKEKLANYCKSVVESINRQKEILLERLQNLVEKFDDERRTQVIQKEIVKVKKNKKQKEEVVEDVIITFNKDGYIQNIPISEFKKTAVKYISSFKTNTSNMLLFFTNFGNAYRVKVSSIKKCGLKDKGIAASTLIKLQTSERVLNVLSMENDNDKPYVVFFTKNGMLKKAEKSIYFGNTQNLNGVKACGLTDDIILGIYPSNGDMAVIGTKNGMVIKFKLDDVSPQGKTSKGVTAINLQNDDKITCVAIVKKEDSVAINGKECKLKAQKRGGKGVKKFDSINRIEVI